MLVPVLTAIPILLAGLLFVWIAYASFKRTLKPNFFIGIRTTKTLSSDEAWEIGHFAAAKSISVGGFGLIFASVLALVIPEDYSVLAALVGAGWVLLWLIIGNKKANDAIEANS